MATGEHHTMTSAEFSANPGRAAALAATGCVTVVDSAGRVLATLSVPREEKTDEWEEGHRAGLALARKRVEAVTIDAIITAWFSGFVTPRGVTAGAEAVRDALLDAVRGAARGDGAEGGTK